MGTAHTMKLIFRGTRGNIDCASRRHRMHSALLIAVTRRRIMIDCGTDWRSRLRAIRPDAILVTHAHPDHAGGLDGGAPCPVYATRKTWAIMASYPLNQRRVLEARCPIQIHGLVVEAFPVIHSLRAPAVGYRLSGDGAAIFYVPDVVNIHARRAALRGAKLFVGDGAALTRPIVHRRGSRLFGHTTIRAQLGWCVQAGIASAIFTHCGSEIVAADTRTMPARVREMGEERGVDARIAYDGLEVRVD